MININNKTLSSNYYYFFFCKFYPGVLIVKIDKMRCILIFKMYTDKSINCQTNTWRYIVNLKSFYEVDKYMFDKYTKYHNI